MSGGHPCFVNANLAGRADLDRSEILIRDGLHHRWIRFRYHPEPGTQHESELQLRVNLADPENPRKKMLPSQNATRPEFAKII